MRSVAWAFVVACLFGGCGDDDSGRRSSDRSDFVGIVTDDVFAGDAAYRDATLDKLADAGIGLIRQTFDWATIEKMPGEYDFSAYDAWLEQVAQKRMRVLAIVFGTPTFRSSAPPRGAEDGTYPPRDFAAFGEFAAALTKRYGPKGTFWRENPDLLEVPIRAWQVWNEPSLPQYWRPAPNATQYAKLLEAASLAIKHVDPNAEIVSAGLPNSKSGVPFERYLDGLLEAGAIRSLDTLGVHPYATDVGGVWGAVRQARRALKHHGSRAPIWISEVGWATGGPQSPFTVGSQGQALRLEQLFEELPDQRRRLGIRGLVYYNWKDSQPHPGGLDFFGLYTGLLTVDGEEKPGFLAFTRGVESVTR